jgi:hypothetical protein
MVCGRTAAARIADPDDPTRNFRWPTLDDVSSSGFKGGQHGC